VLTLFLCGIRSAPKGFGVGTWSTGRERRRCCTDGGGVRVCLWFGGLLDLFGRVVHAAAQLVTVLLCGLLCCLLDVLGGVFGAFGRGLGGLLGDLLAVLERFLAGLLGLFFDLVSDRAGKDERDSSARDFASGSEADDSGDSPGSPSSAASTPASASEGPSIRTTGKPNRSNTRRVSSPPLKSPGRNGSSPGNWALNAPPSK